MQGSSVALGSRAFLSADRRWRRAAADGDNERLLSAAAAAARGTTRDRGSSDLLNPDRSGRRRLTRTSVCMHA